MDNREVHEVVNDAEATVSVVIPTYNGEAFLGFALDSLLYQQPAIFEVLLIDDGSSDRTVSVARSYSRRLPIRILQTGRHANWVKTTNIALRETRGEFLSILHQDDCWLPRRLTLFQEALRAEPDLDLFLNPSQFIDANGRVLGVWNAPLLPSRLLSPTEILPGLIVQNFISMPGPIFRRELISRDIATGTGPLDESLWFTADWKLWLTLARRGRWYYQPVPLTCFRVHPGSLTVGARIDDAYRRQFYSVLDSFLPQVIREHPGRGERINRLASLSMNMNLFLAELFANKSVNIRPVLRSAFALSPQGWIEYFVLSRIHERIASRVRAYLRGPSHSESSGQPLHEKV